MSSSKTISIVMGSHWSRQMGGAQFQAKCIVEALLEDGRWSVDYLASLTDPAFSPENYRIHSIGNNRRISRIGGFLADGPRLTRKLKEVQPDIVYQRGLKAYTGILARWSRQTGRPFVFHIAHDDDVAIKTSRELLRHSVSKFADKRVGEYGLNRATAIIAQTEQQAAALEENYGIKAAMIAPNFHPLPRSSVEKSDAKMLVAWVANFKQVKRPELFVDLAEYFRGDDRLEFIMIGRSGNPEIYGELLDRIRKLKNMHYMGEQTIEVVNSTLSDSHLFVNTSVSEGFPNTFIQAWMRKVPVLSLDVDPDGVLAKQHIGVCCHSMEAMRVNVEHLARDDSARIEMGERAQLWASRTHGPAAASRITEFLFKAAGPVRTGLNR